MGRFQAYQSETISIFSISELGATSIEALASGAIVAISVIIFMVFISRQMANRGDIERQHAAYQVANSFVSSISGSPMRQIVKLCTDRGVWDQATINLQAGRCIVKNELTSQAPTGTPNPSWPKMAHLLGSRIVELAEANSSITGAFPSCIEIIDCRYILGLSLMQVTLAYHSAATATNAVQTRAVVFRRGTR